MSDPTDFASEREQKELERAIAAARSRSSITIAISEECANDCGELRAPPSRYCCAECRDQADYRERIRRNQGIR